MVGGLVWLAQTAAKACLVQGSAWGLLSLVGLLAVLIAMALRRRGV